MTESSKKKTYDLEDRTFEFARRVRVFVRGLPKTVSTIEDAKQLVRSSGSVGANYIEACEALSKKDFVMRIKISRKEAKESCFWLRLLHVDGHVTLAKERDALVQESAELTKIFGAIVTKAG
ncbi:MAG TPA: four helix bundle protein [Kiritimatiellia bacterium]|nr:four helix bundle protein [Kiritimatiellia bacterium]